MSIEIYLHKYWKHGVKSTHIEELEELEDAIRDLLISRGFNKFSIEDSYTGNTLS